MRTVRDHYNLFLGNVYSWILGDFESARQRNAGLFDSLELRPDGNAIAVDLGCGPGCQSLPLAERGYDVLAIDFCQSLIDELGQRKGTASIRTVCDDLLNFRSYMSEPAELIVCMGDTLVHLPDINSVERVIDEVCDSLRPGGLFIYAIRDYMTGVPEGRDRFIPIRSSDELIFTCFLDYGEEKVHVHDILHRKVGGEWKIEISDYLKLRLDSHKIDGHLRRRGLEISGRSLADGMIVVVAKRPA
jgi:SAM-dependent methyltransferase